MLSVTQTPGLFTTPYHPVDATDSSPPPVHSLPQAPPAGCEDAFPATLCNKLEMVQQLIAANLNKLQPAAGGQAPELVEDAAANCYLGAACTGTPTLTKDQVINTLDCYNSGHPKDYDKCTGLVTTDWPPHCGCTYTQVGLLTRDGKEAREGIQFAPPPRLGSPQ